MRIALKVMGKEMLFSQEELIAIIEEHYRREDGQTKKVKGRVFHVSPKEIKRELFKEVRLDEKQEKVRRIILRAFRMVDEFPEMYSKPFTTLVPIKTWAMKEAKELEIIAGDLGDHLADWVEQALEWAQRITNGESWESLCNTYDDSRYYRLIIGEKRILGRRKYWLIGGSTQYKGYESATNMDEEPYHSGRILWQTVPLIVIEGLQDFT